MSEQQSPWSRSGSVDTEPAAAAYPQTPKQPVGPLIDVGPGWSRSGTVTGLGGPAPDVLEAGGRRGPSSAQRRMLAWVGGAAAGVVGVGLVVLLGLAMTGSGA